jgi:sulfhydrogenase subunit delta
MGLDQGREGMNMETKLGRDVSCHAHTLDDKLAKLREKRVKGAKLKVGVFGITGCAGCQLTILFAKEKFFSFLKMVDVLALPFIKEQNYKGRFDIIILEGLVASEEDKKKATELRARCDVLLCLGACAVHGCVPAMKNFMDHPEVERAVYAKIEYLNSLAATPVSKHVPVDVELPGCPPDENQIYAVLTDLVLGRPPRVTHNPVCVECVKREVECLLIKGKPCLGPITTGGCDAICTAAGHECMGCRGPTEDANLVAFINLLVKKGFARADIESRLHTYAGLLVQEEEKAQNVPQRYPDTIMDTSLSGKPQN